jgi:hypothetical protein
LPASEPRSAASVLRLTRERGLQVPGRVGRPQGPQAHDGTIRTERVDLMWGSDLTSAVTAEGQASIFVAVDHCSAECIGIHAARRAIRFEALEPIRQGVRACLQRRDRRLHLSLQHHRHAVPNGVVPQATPKASPPGSWIYDRED